MIYPSRIMEAFVVPGPLGASPWVPGWVGGLACGWGLGLLLGCPLWGVFLGSSTFFGSHVCIFMPAFFVENLNPLRDTLPA